MKIEYNEKYITFDTVKIKCDINCLINKNLEFNKSYNHKTGELAGESYSSKGDVRIPYNVYIALSYPQKTLTIEFSSKVLLEYYPKLISKHTFRQCIDNINQLGICSLDTENIISTGCFTKLDVTVDKQFQLDESVLNSLNMSVQNYRRFRWSHYINEGITFAKDVKSADCKECITLYDKKRELSNGSNNRKFLSSLSNKIEILDYFEGKTRFEITLATQEKIKSYLKVADTKIMTVLQSCSNPIGYQFERIFGNSDTRQVNCKIEGYDDYTMQLIIDSCDRDLKQVEQLIRNKYNTRSGYEKRMSKIRVIYDKMLNSQNYEVGIVEQIKKLLSE